MDPITKLGELALNHKINLHVDACLGGFVIPFAKEYNIKLENFNFTVPGVTSIRLLYITISADTHKYGLAPKGNSILLYKTKELRHY